MNKIEKLQKEQFKLKLKLFLLLEEIKNGQMKIRKKPKRSYIQI